MEIDFTEYIKVLCRFTTKLSKSNGTRLCKLFFQLTYIKDKSQFSVFRVT